jgi:PKHD-type hydroxylase|tara:strand:+ start:2858 stop:3523 length:666 start_codon:yes stop_codon:yes gene_type:complete
LDQVGYIIKNNMNLENIYWYFDGILPHRFCDELIKYGNHHEDQLAMTGDQHDKTSKGIPLNETDIKNLKKKRDSRVVWLSDPWIYKEIHPYVHGANRNAGWNFDWTWSEACQFTKYKTGQYYGWHTDSWAKEYREHNNINYNGKTRKLSVSVLLSDPSDYKGGDLQFKNKMQEEGDELWEPPSLKKGSIIVFPSFIWHRVKPVTDGIRYSLVVWNLGAPFR